MNYSNFSNIILGKDPTDPFYNPQFDSLKIFMSNQNSNLTFTYKFGNQNHPQNLTVISNFIQTKNYQGEIDNSNVFGIGISNQITPSNIFNNSINYNVSFKSQESTLQFSTTYILQSQGTGSSHFIGPTLRYNQKILKKNP